MRFRRRALFQAQVLPAAPRPHVIGELLGHDCGCCGSLCKRGLLLVVRRVLRSGVAPWASALLPAPVDPLIALLPPPPPACPVLGRSSHPVKRRRLRLKDVKGPVRGGDLGCQVPLIPCGSKSSLTEMQIVD